MKSIKPLYLVFLSLLIGSGCGVSGIAAGGRHRPPSDTNPPQPAPTKMINAPVSQQLIIKFKPNTIACNSEGIALLSSTTHVSLEFVRTMSGDACVVKQIADSEEDLLQGQKTLKNNLAVEYLEPDVVMEPMKPL